MKQSVYRILLFVLLAALVVSPFTPMLGVLETLIVIAGMSLLAGSLWIVAGVIAFVATQSRE